MTRKGREWCGFLLTRLVGTGVDTLVMLVAFTAAMSLLSGPGAGPWRRMALPLLSAATALPLAFVSGAGAAGGCSLGVTLAGGYIAYAALGGLSLRR